MASISSFIGPPRFVRAVRKPYSVVGRPYDQNRSPKPRAHSRVRVSRIVTKQTSSSENQKSEIRNQKKTSDLSFQGAEGGPERSEGGISHALDSVQSEIPRFARNDMSSLGRT